MNLTQQQKDRVESILSQMTLEEKIGQVNRSRRRLSEDSMFPLRN